MRPRISSHEVKNIGLHLTRLSMIMLLQWKAKRRSALLIKNNYILIKHRKRASIWLSLSWWIHKPQNITAHYIYFRVNMYNHYSFSCRIVKFQLRTFKFVFVLQVIVGPLAAVSCDTLCLLFLQKTKTVNRCSWLTKHHRKGKRIAWKCNYMKIRWDFGMETKYLFN